MALLNNQKNILPLSSISELLNTKTRTLKIYEEKLLLPLEKDKTIKKLYSIDDIKIIAFVHYLATIKNKFKWNFIYFGDNWRQYGFKT